MTLRSILALSIAALAAAHASASITYSYDNGTTSVAVGPPNSFPVNPHAQTFILFFHRPFFLYHLPHRRLPSSFPTIS